MSSKDRYSHEDLRADFPSQEYCLNYVFDLLHNRKCSCGGEYKLMMRARIYKKVKTKKMIPGKRFQCSKCRTKVSPFVDTIFHKSDTPLPIWFQAILSFSNHKSGISASTLQREINVTYKCAWRILKEIRKALGDESGKLKGMVESDQGFFGTKVPRQEMINKTKVIAAVERGGRIKAGLIDTISTAYTHKFIRDAVEEGSSLYTDASATYTNLGKDYDLRVIEPTKKHCKGGYHVSHVDNFFSHVKRSIRGTFKSVSKRHFSAYLASFVWLYNNRHNDRTRFFSLLDRLLHV